MGRGRTLSLLLTLAVLAGCVGPTADDAPPSEEDAPPATPTEARPEGVDATAGVPRAFELARAWDTGSALVGVMGAEGLYAQPDDPPYIYDTRADPHVGDGLALAWTYAFAAQGRAGIYFVTLAADGTTLYDHEQAGPVGFTQPTLPADFVASARAAEVVAQNATTQRWVAEHPTSFVRLGLTATDRGASWFYHRATASGFGLYALVDASSGALLELSDSSGPIIVDPPRPCGPDHVCGPYQPEPPETPAPEQTRKDATLSAFNQQAEIAITPTHWEFAFDLLVTAEVGGATPLDERTLTLYGIDGEKLGETSGTGTLTLTMNSTAPLAGAPLRAVVTSKAPPAQEAPVELSMLLTYTRYVGYMMRASMSGWGQVGLKQVADVPMDVPPQTNVTMRVTITPNGPAPATASTTDPTTWALLDPQGTAVAEGTSPGGEVEFEAPDGGTYTLRVTGGSDAAFIGASFHYAMTAMGSPDAPWM